MEMSESNQMQRFSFGQMRSQNNLLPLVLMSPSGKSIALAKSPSQLLSQSGAVSTASNASCSNTPQFASVLSTMTKAPPNLLAVAAANLKRSIDNKAAGSSSKNSKPATKKQKINVVPKAGIVLQPGIIERVAASKNEKRIAKAQQKKGKSKLGDNLLQEKYHAQRLNDSAQPIAVDSIVASNSINQDILGNKTTSVTIPTTVVTYSHTQPLLLPLNNQNTENQQIQQDDPNLMTPEQLSSIVAQRFRSGQLNLNSLFSPQEGQIVVEELNGDDESERTNFDELDDRELAATQIVTPDVTPVSSPPLSPVKSIADPNGDNYGGSDDHEPPHLDGDDPNSKDYEISPSAEIQSESGMGSPRTEATNNGHQPPPMSGTVGMISLNLVEVEKCLHGKYCFHACRNRQDLILEKLNMILSLLTAKQTNRIVQLPAKKFRLLPSFPLDTKNQLSDFNSLLEKGLEPEEGQHNGVKPEEVQAEFMAFLSGIGGKDLVDSVHNILQRIMTDNLANQCVWCQKSGDKLILCDFFIVTVLTAVIMSMEFKEETTESAIGNIMKEWLRRSPDRIKYAAQKKNRQHRKRCEKS